VLEVFHLAGQMYLVAVVRKEMYEEMFICWWEEVLKKHPKDWVLWHIGCSVCSSNLPCMEVQP